MAELEIRAPRDEHELHLANDLMAKIHHRDYFEAIRWFDTSAAGYPGHRPDFTRIAFSRGQAVGALRINAETIRLGEARLRMAGLGYVTTHPDHRHKGIGRALVVDSLSWLRRQQFHVSTLFGIPNFYERLGYVSTLPEYTVDISVEEAQAQPPAEYRARAGKPGDIRAVQRIHAQDDNATACSIVRSAAHITNRWERWKGLQVLTSPQGKVVAYYVPRRTPDALEIDEAGVAERPALAALLRACGDAAHESYRGRIRFLMPHNHPVARSLAQLRAEFSTRLHRDSGGMMAFISLGETFESMLPEWESQLQRHAAREAHTELTLMVNGKSWLLRAHRGALAIAAGAGRNKLGLSEPELMHLLTGYVHPDDIVDARRRILTQDARDLLLALFPKRTPYVWPLDRF